jgi:hypothetical protein
MAPKARRETINPVSPKREYCMPSSFANRPVPRQGERV